MSYNLLAPFSALAILCCIPSCANKTEKPTEDAKKENETKPRLVGRVASIPAERKFILIQSYGTWDVPTGAILVTKGPEGRTANLRVTGEKLGQFAAADIQSGTLEIGDGAYTSITPKKIAEANPEPEETTPDPKPESKPEQADEKPPQPE